MGVSVVFVANLLGCGPSVESSVQGATESGRGTGTTGSSAPEEIVLWEVDNRRLDILLVVDNSSSTAPIQARLMEALPHWLEALGDDPDARREYRLAVTTTDSGNVLCDHLTTPESGSFVTTSCRQRLSDFEAIEADDRDTCLQACDLDSLGMTTPWIEVTASGTNLPPKIDPVAAASCLVPQGISGCGFESPLESMRRALTRARDPSAPEFGFLRDDAVLLVVFVTDEADCSARPEHQLEVFGPDGNRVFWSEHDASFPSSAVCWNAGVSCTGLPDGYQCESADKGIAGQPADPSEAVLVPVQEYVDLLQAIEDEKQQRCPDTEVFVSALSGVPVGFDGDDTIPYAEGPDPEDPDSFQSTFGIGPGCSDEAVQAVPPVRLREFARAFEVDRNNLYSVCSTDYTDALFESVLPVRGQRPLCVPVCVADLEHAPGVQPDCTVRERWVDDDGQAHEVVLPECEGEGQLVPGHDACVVYLGDAGGLSDEPTDDMDPYCIDEGWNLELRIVRTPGAPPPNEAMGTIECEPSTTPSIDCPR